MVTKAQIKFIQSLSQRKSRREAGVFVAEGTKCVEDLLASSAEVVDLFAVAEWLATRRETLPKTVPVWEVSERELRSMSELTTANQVLAVIKIPEHCFDAAAFKGKLVLGLDVLQDPGNLGSIIRLCDWFGVGDIVAGRETVDCYNPKVVQATMGSIARVRVHYCDNLVQSAQEIKNAGVPICATTLDGDDIYRARLPRGALVLFGNESAGLSEELASLCTSRLRIPNFSENSPRAESLNVAIAAGIVCSEFRRRGTST